MFCKKCGTFNLPYTFKCWKCGSEIYGNFWDGMKLRDQFRVFIVILICFDIILIISGYSIDFIEMIKGFSIGLIIGIFYKKYIFSEIKGNIYFTSPTSPVALIIVAILMTFDTMLDAFFHNSYIGTSRILDDWIYSSVWGIILVPYFCLLKYENKNGTVYIKMLKN